MRRKATDAKGSCARRSSEAADLKCGAPFHKRRIGFAPAQGHQSRAVTRARRSCARRPSEAAVACGFQTKLEYKSQKFGLRRNAMANLYLILWLLAGLSAELRVVARRCVCAESPCFAQRVQALRRDSCLRNASVCDASFARAAPRHVSPASAMRASLAPLRGM